MNILDIILLICFVPALVQGLRKGFISQAIGLLSLIAGIWASTRFATMVSGWLSKYIDGSEQTLRIVAFVLIFIAIIAVLTLIGKLLEKIFDIVMLGWLNKLLGVVLALLKSGLIVGLLIMAFCPVNDSLKLVNESVLNSSVLFPPLKEAAYTIFPYLKELLTSK